MTKVPYSRIEISVLGYPKVADLLASNAPARGLGAIWEAGGFRYEELPAGTAANLIHLTTAGGVLLKVLPDEAGDLPFSAFAPARDGVTNDAAIFAVAKTAADALGIYLSVEPGSYVAATTLEMPQRVKGDFKVIGAVKFGPGRDRMQKGKIHATGNITCSGLYYGEFDYLMSDGDIICDGADASTGMFWCTFYRTRTTGTLILDVDKGQSVNFNRFLQHRGGVHIKGVQTTGTREAHGNEFTIDSTGANITAADGTTGCHIVNDSNLNQQNTILSAYVESTGSGFIKGNWEILSLRNNYSGSVLLTGRRNSALFSMGDRRNGAFLAFPSRSASRGSDWGELGGTTGYPLGMSKTGGTTSTVVAKTNTPDGNPWAVEFSDTGLTFKRFSLNYDLSNQEWVSFTAYMAKTNGGVDAMQPSEIFYVQDSAGGITDAIGVSMTPVGNGWYLARGAFKSSRTLAASGGALTGQITRYVSGSSPTGDVWTIGSYFVSTESMCPLPQFKPGPRTYYGTAAPTAGTAAQGDFAINTAPTAGGTPGWRCTTAGTPGTWKAMPALAT